MWISAITDDIIEAYITSMLLFLLLHSFVKPLQTIRYHFLNIANLVFIPWLAISFWQAMQAVNECWNFSKAIQAELPDYGAGMGANCNKMLIYFLVTGCIFHLPLLFKRVRINIWYNMFSVALLSLLFTLNFTIGFSTLIEGEFVRSKSTIIYTGPDYPAGWSYFIYTACPGMCLLYAFIKRK